jgi:hypothetical protein
VGDYVEQGRFAGAEPVLSAPTTATARPDQEGRGRCHGTTACQTPTRPWLGGPRVLTKRLKTTASQHKGECLGWVVFDASAVRASVAEADASERRTDDAVALVASTSPWRLGIDVRRQRLEPGRSHHRFRFRGIDPVAGAVPASGAMLLHGTVLRRDLAKAQKTPAPPSSAAANRSVMPLPSGWVPCTAAPSGRFGGE